MTPLEPLSPNDCRTARTPIVSPILCVEFRVFNMEPVRSLNVDPWRSPHSEGPGSSCLFATLAAFFVYPPQPPDRFAKIKHSYKLFFFFIFIVIFEIC